MKRQRPAIRFYLCTLIMVSVAATWLLGCSAQLLGGKTVISERRKFLIEAKPLRLPFKNSERPYNYHLEIKKFNVSRLYDQDRIVIRLSDVEIRENRQQVWSVRPSEMLTDVVEQYFKKSDLFVNASQEFLDMRPDYVFSGTVSAIEELKTGGSRFARLAMSMQITDTEKNQIIWSGEFDDQPPVPVDDMGKTVQTMRDILHRNMEEYLVELDFRFLNIAREVAKKELLTRTQYDTTDQEETDPTADIPISTSVYKILNLSEKLYPEDR
jgi:ABC-type uncharacterized transport system auxiliary subunit